MKEIKGDLFSIDCDAVCITTNGYVKSNGQAVMGKGCAKQAAEYFPDLPKLLGDRITKNGNVVNLLRHYQGVAILSFPVKPITRECRNPDEDIVSHMCCNFTIGQDIPGWACTASLSLIKTSAEQLVKIVDHNKWETVLIPRVGAGCKIGLAS